MKDVGDAADIGTVCLLVEESNGVDSTSSDTPLAAFSVSITEKVDGDEDILKLETAEGQKEMDESVELITSDDEDENDMLSEEVFESLNEVSFEREDLDKLHEFWMFPALCTDKVLFDTVFEFEFCTVSVVFW